MGRRKLPAEERSIPVQLPQGVVDLIDGYILDALVRTGAIDVDEPTNRQVAARRRKFICDLVERELSLEAQTRVRVIAPVFAPIGGPFGDPTEEIREATEWMRREEAPTES